MPFTAPSTTPPRGLQAAFEAWCTHQRQSGRLRRAASIDVYRAMWQALAAWCAAQSPPLRLPDLQPPALAAYLASRTGLLLVSGGLTPRYQQRLLSLVRRVQAHRAWLLQTGRLPHPGLLAAPRAPLAVAAAIDVANLPEPPLHLAPADDDRLQNLLTAAPATAAQRWQTWRDRCAVALQLGAGLGPGALRALRTADVISDGGPVRGLPAQLRVPASGSAPAHLAPLASWAAPVLAQWLRCRADQALPGPWLFPSTRGGKPWGKVAQYEAARRVLADAGLDPDGGGSFRLRHSFALRQLRHGVDDDLLTRWLGIVDPAVIARYRQALPGGGQVMASPLTAAAEPPSPTRPCWPV